MTLAQVEKATNDINRKVRREFVSAPTDKAIAYAILGAIVNGFKEAGYARSNDELDKPLPTGCEILRSAKETVAFQVVTHE